MQRCDHVLGAGGKLQEMRAQPPRLKNAAIGRVVERLQNPIDQIVRLRCLRNPQRIYADRIDSGGLAIGALCDGVSVESGLLCEQALEAVASDGNQHREVFVQQWRQQVDRRSADKENGIELARLQEIDGLVRGI